MDLKWDYDKREVKVPMRGYTQKALKESGYQPRTKPFQGPTKYDHPEYGRQTQYEKIDISSLLCNANKRCIQKLAGKFLYKV